VAAAILRVVFLLGAVAVGFGLPVVAAAVLLRLVVLVAKAAARLRRGPLRASGP
jgi:hypothetical protein